MTEGPRLSRAARLPLGVGEVAQDVRELRRREELGRGGVGRGHHNKVGEIVQPNQPGRSAARPRIGNSHLRQAASLTVQGRRSAGGQKEGARCGEQAEHCPRQPH